MTAGEIARWVGGHVERDVAGVALRGVAIDSRVVAPGMLFIALPGTQTDGHRFVREAARRGAGAALVPRLRSSATVG